MGSGRGGKGQGEVNGAREKKYYLCCAHRARNPLLRRRMRRRYYQCLFYAYKESAELADNNAAAHCDT